MSSFEDLNVWQRAKQLAVEVIRGLQDSRNYSLRDQIIRSAISISSNVAEGAERKGNKEFANFISYASGSSAELMTQIMIAKELGELPAAESDKWIQECREISKMLYALRKSVTASL
jgi:four helix bundle protein